MSKYYKILPENLKCKGFQYQEGLNIDTNLVTPCKFSYGLHFSDAEHILSFYDHCSMIAEVEIPEDAIVYHCADQSKADRIILKNIRPLWSVETIKALIQEGVNFAIHEYDMIYESISNGYPDVAKYLIEHGANPHADYDRALFSACGNGYFDVVKCLVDHGTDIHTWNDYALGRASSGGHLDIVKYLVEQGADIHADDDDALYWASCYGYLDIVKYLVEHGANIYANDEYAIWESGSQEIEEYLKSLL